MNDYDSFDDRRIKHLEMIQAVIGRLGNDSFLIKGWTVTVAAAFLGFAVTQDKWQLALASVGPTLLFWLLDGTYLRNERLFRDLFDRVRKCTPEIEPFFMGATGDPYINRLKQEWQENGSESVVSLWATLGRRALYLFYGAVIIAALLAAVIICRTYNGRDARSLPARTRLADGFSHVLFQRSFHRLVGGPDVADLVVLPPRNHV